MIVRKAPAILAGIFIAITLVRVAQFTSGPLSAGLLGWLFASALGVGVYISAYYTRQHVSRSDGKIDQRDSRSRQVALISLILFVIADGLFNLADVWRMADTSTPLYFLAAAVYGAFPTLAAALLGWLQGHVDRLPQPPRRLGVLLAVRAAIVRRIDAPLAPVPQAIPAPADNPAEIPQSTLSLYTCERCQSWRSDPQRSPTDQQRQYAGHMRSHAKAAGGSGNRSVR